jgi:hypothetical protein
MHARLFFSLLSLALVIVCAMSLLEAMITGLTAPRLPCVSAINNGEFIGDDFKHFTFNGTITFWLNEKMISAFGVIDTGQDKAILRRELLLGKVEQRQPGIITATISERRLSSTDNAGSTRVLLSDKNESIALVFSRIKAGIYLVNVNDNWVMMCEEK